MNPKCDFCGKEIPEPFAIYVTKVFTLQVPVVVEDCPVPFGPVWKVCYGCGCCIDCGYWETLIIRMTQLGEKLKFNSKKSEQMARTLLKRFRENQAQAN